MSVRNENNNRKERERDTKRESGIKYKEIDEKRERNSIEREKERGYKWIMSLSEWMKPKQNIKMLINMYIEYNKYIYKLV